MLVYKIFQAELPSQRQDLVLPLSIWGVGRTYKVHTHAAKELRRLLSSQMDRPKQRSERWNHIDATTTDITQVQAAILLSKHKISTRVLTNILEITRFHSKRNGSGGHTLEPTITGK